MVVRDVDHSTTVDRPKRCTCMAGLVDDVVDDIVGPMGGRTEASQLIWFVVADPP